MNKQIEAGMLVAVAALMVMSAAGIMQETEKSNVNQIDVYLRTEWNHLTHWLTSKTTPVSSRTGKPAVSIHESVPSQSKSPSPAALTTLQSSSAADNMDTYKRLSEIGVGFVDSMSQQDWNNLVKALNNSDADRANQVVSDMIDQHISPKDRGWLVSRFTGNQSFSKEDITMLRETVRDIEHELTPEELKLLHEAYPAIPQTMP